MMGPIVRLRNDCSPSWRLLCLVSVSVFVVLVSGALAGPAWAGETFGLKAFGSTIENRDHAPVVQAGAHPYAVSMAMVFSHEVTEEVEDFEINGKGEEVPLGEPEVFAKIYGSPRDLELDLPAGVVVDPEATSEKCTEAQLETTPATGGSCPAASAVGMVTVYSNRSGEKVKGAIYNMAPPPGVPAEFGMDPGEVGLVIHIVGRIRTDGDYGFSADVSEISQKVSIYGLELTLWGDPSAASHDAQRGICASRGTVEKAIEEEFYEKEIIEDGKAAEEYRFSCPTERTDTSLLTMPGACTGSPLETTLSVDSWQEPGALNQDGTPDLSDPRWKTAGSSSPPVTGCGALEFTPSLEVEPAPEPTAASDVAAAPEPVAAAESPTGLNVDLKIPHDEHAEHLAEADLHQLSVTLPPGMAISLSAANGLGACTDAPEPDRPEGEIALHSDEPVRCPESSKIGEATVVTPLIEEPLKGAVYLAQQETFEGSLIGLYVVLESGGVLVKLAGKATLDPSTGQITIAFADIPQLPLGELELSLYGGPRAALVAPSGCGAYTVTSQLTPWSGTPPTTPSSSFTVGSDCAQGFAPSFDAGTTDSHAGASSPFSITIARQDGEQRLSSVRVVAPSGLVGVLAGVPQCPEPQAATGACPGASEVGEASIAAGPGPDPVWIRGHIYLTGPYAGAPFGLSMVIPAAAGPFELGTVVVRARIEIDSHTAQLIISSDPLPSIVAGVPLDIRTIDMTIDGMGGKSNFIVNPTNCAPLSVSGTISSTAGANVVVSSPFEAVDCASLPFTPHLTAATQARTSRSRGASLSIRIAAPPGQANIAKVRLILPWQLPARLTTLQHACTASVFDVNPASCPAASIVGTVTAVTPLLAHPLTGPAYLLARSSAAFPDLALVLQGEGIVLYLDGNTDIKKDLTSATFNSIPDLPIDTFEVALPEGPHSILGTSLPARAGSSLCGQSLVMPTALTAQNGAVLAQTTHVAITGCPKPRSRARRKKARRTGTGKTKTGKTGPGGRRTDGKRGGGRTAEERLGR
jgi:hypothetical protein